MASRLLKFAAIYLMIGVTMGLVMGIARDFRFAPVHAHLNLLGWASLGLAALVYYVYPEATKTRLAQVHFWLHVTGLPVFMLGLLAMLAGFAQAGPLVAVGATATWLAVLAFVVNLLRTIGRGDLKPVAPREAGRVATHIEEWR
jgi:cbb3-type cytochrome oxidase subunit 1